MAILALAASGSAPAAGLRPERLGVAPRVPSGALALGSLPQSTPVQAIVTLQPRDGAGLAAYAQAVSTPGSSLYHQYLTVAQFARRFGPSAAQVANVRASLQAQGLASGPLSANRLSFSVSAPEATVAIAFSTLFQRYRLADGTTGFTNTVAASLDPEIAGLVQGVVGLNTLAIREPMALRSTATRRRGPVAGPAGVPGQARPCAAASTDANAHGAYTADQIAAASRFSSLYGAGDLGAGVTVALYELEPYAAGDIAAYQSCYATTATVTNVSVGGGAGSGYGSGEAALDIEAMVGLAPKASIRVYEGPNTGAGAYLTYSRIIGDDRAQVVSTSWGSCEALASSATAAESTLFQEAAVQGQSVVAASGDRGADDCANGAPAVDDPASQPYVTGVGGTSLPSPVPAAAQSVWNGAAGAGGGGVSTLWAAPSYQSAAALSQSSATCGAAGSSCREVPDVSADADPNTGYAVYHHGRWGAVGGTSAAAPTWAALTALADSSAICTRAGTRVGFANPALYRAAADGYSGNFVDVTSGDNSYGQVAGFSAGARYDMASGLGAPNGSALAPALCGDLVTVAQPPAQSSVAAAGQSLQLEATSSAGTPISYGASGLPPGLSVGPATGKISGTPSTAGTWTVTGAATDASGSTGNAYFTWVVTGLPSPSTPILAPPSTPARSLVRLTRPAAQAGWIGTAERLRIKASDSLGLTLTYAATGLPPGLSINPRTGLISGKPSRPGDATVFVRASDSLDSSAGAVFRWTVAGRPQVTASSLRLLRGDHAILSLSLSAGCGAAAIERIVIAAPRGTLRFSSRRRDPAPGVSAWTRSGRRLRARSQLLRGALVVTLGARSAPRDLTLRLSVPEISLTRRLSVPEISLTRRLIAIMAGPRSRLVTLTITVTDSRHVRTRLLVAVAGSSKGLRH